LHAKFLCRTAKRVALNVLYDVNGVLSIPSLGRRRNTVVALDRTVLDLADAPHRNDLWYTGAHTGLSPKGSMGIWFARGNHHLAARFGDRADALVMTAGSWKAPCGPRILSGQPGDAEGEASHTSTFHFFAPCAYVVCLLAWMLSAPGWRKSGGGCAVWGSIFGGREGRKQPPSQA
jgi:hypothetical protein